MLSFFHSDAFQIGLDSLLNPIRRNHLVKHNAKLSISAELARRTHLQDRTRQLTFPPEETGDRRQ